MSADDIAGPTHVSVPATAVRWLIYGPVARLLATLWVPVSARLPGLPTFQPPWAQRAGAPMPIHGTAPLFPVQMRGWGSGDQQGTRMRGYACVYIARVQRSCACVFMCGVFRISVERCSCVCHMRNDNARSIMLPGAYMALPGSFCEWIVLACSGMQPRHISAKEVLWIS